MDIILPDLCDTHGDRVTVLAPLFRNFGAQRAFGGPISTIKCFEDNSLVAEAVEEPGAGRVLVVDGGASDRCALLGDNLARKAAANGWAGIVIYGAVRDVQDFPAIDLGIQALLTHPRKSVKRGLGDRDLPVTFAGVTLVPGAYLYADDNGIITSSTALL
jgi:regulator of ribonuclease activity A